MRRNIKWLGAWLGAATLVVGVAVAQTIGQPTGGDTSVGFDTSYAAGSSDNIDPGGLAAGSIEMLALSTPLNQGWYRSPRGAYGMTPYWLHMEKDDTTTWAWTSQDSCLEADLAEGVSQTFGSTDLFLFDMMAASTNLHRVGPETGADFLDTLASGEPILPPTEAPRPAAMRFLTSPARGSSGSADYTVRFYYGSCPCGGGQTCDTGSNTCYIEDAGVEIEDGSTAAGRNDAIGACRVTARGTRTIADSGTPTCATGYLDEVSCTNPDTTEDLSSIEITYTAAELDGPLAVSLDVGVAAYNAMFPDYQATYVTTSTALDGGDARAFWVGADWTQTIDDGGTWGPGGDPAALGSVSIEVSCTGSPAFDTFSSNTGAGSELWGGGGAYCVGRYAEYTVTLDAWLDTRPSLDTLLLTYDVDHDNDGIGVEGYPVAGGAMGAIDCDDDDNDQYPGNTEVPGHIAGQNFGIDEDCNGFIDCYDDVDHDGFGSTRLVNAAADDETCDAPNDAVEAGPPVYGPRSPVNTDCLDVDNTEGQNTFPGAAECDDGTPTSGGCTNTTDCMTDIDGDDFGDNTPSGGVTAGTDCLDTGVNGPFRNPGLAEECDGIDNNCAGGVPEPETDTDLDGYVECEITTWRGAGSPGGEDCADDAPVDGVPAADINPGNTDDTIDGNDADEDCDGEITCYDDTDEDGYGEDLAAANPTRAFGGTCDDAGMNYADDDTDCQDNIAVNGVAASLINPGARDVCGNEVDEDCDLNAELWTGLGGGQTQFADSDNADEDGDGILDVDEQDSGGGRNVTDICDVDTDNDGLSDLQEESAQDQNGSGHAFGATDPADADSDDDGIDDFEELNGQDGDGASTGFGDTDPNTFDGDGDGLGDGQELGVTSGVDYGAGGSCGASDCSDGSNANQVVEIFGTDVALTIDDDPGSITSPLLADTDGDDLCDGNVVVGAVCPDGAEDTDADGEYDPGPVHDPGVGESDPTAIDSDSDGICDHDGAAGVGCGAACVGSELDQGTRAWDADSDDDGLSDGAEDIDCSGTFDGDEPDPNNPDTDGDSLCDGGRFPVSPYPDDTCGGNEFGNGTDPRDVDSDADGLDDDEELPAAGNTDAMDTDSDDDGISDGTEVDVGLNPNARDHDGDGIRDGVEDVSMTNGLLNGYPDNQSTTTGLIYDGSGSYTRDADIGSSTSPFLPDTDGDTLCDGTLTPGPACAGGEDTGSGGGTANDGAVNGNELDPLDSDGDDDALTDGEEVLTYLTDPRDQDDDGDGLHDGQELGRDLAFVAAHPALPGDLLADYPYDGTGDDTPFNPDTHTDSKTDPLDADSDNDGLCDGPDDSTNCEGGEDVDFNGAVNGNETNPVDRDSDDDGLCDGLLGGVCAGRGEDLNDDGDYDAGSEPDPNNEDTDGDGLNDGLESGQDTPLIGGMSSGNSNTRVAYTGTQGWTGDGDTNTTTDPLDPDSDDDGLCDGADTVAGECTLGAEDDGRGGGDAGDGAINGDEPNPMDADSDDDGLTDGEETTGAVTFTVTYDPTDPVVADHDSDGLSDGLEVGRTTPIPGGTSDGLALSYDGTDGWQPDTDRPTSAVQVFNPGTPCVTCKTTDPVDPDSDDDEICDGPGNGQGACQQGNDGGEDDDADGAVDADETNPLDADSDDDTLTDGAEELHACNPAVVPPSPGNCTDPLDDDSDDDNVLDAAEVFQVWPLPTGGSAGTIDNPTNSDGDGLINALDDDDDNDNVDTIDEDYEDDDHDFDPDPDGLPETDDRDRDGIPNFLDTDDDGDSLLTADELAGTGVACGGGELADLDADGWPNYLDWDDDGDFNPNHDDDNDNDGDFPGEPNDPDSPVQFYARTLDEIAAGTDPCDPDSDGDGVLDGVEFGFDPTNPRNTDVADLDGDALINALDEDDDADGVLTIQEDAGSGGQAGWDDTDPTCTGDGIPNYLDVDSDGDGVCDRDHETVPGVCFHWQTPGELSLGLGADRDPTAVTVFLQERLDQDPDLDGLPTIFDCLDFDANADRDFDGLPSVLEEQTLCALATSCPEYAWESCGDDSDVDGTCDDPDDIEGCCSNPDNPDTDSDCVGDLDETVADLNINSDNDSLPDVLDPDDDNDSVLTNLEYYELVPNPGACPVPADGGNGQADEAAFPVGDGSMCIQAVDGEVVRVLAALCDPNDNPATYIGPQDMDTDDDGIPDYQDMDDDGDGIDTIDEDPTGNGDPKDDDEDYDFLPDYLDAIDDGPCGDLDGDGINNNVEASLGTSVTSVDSDDDGVLDNEELWQTGACAWPHATPSQFDDTACVAAFGGFDYACPTIDCCAGADQVSDPLDDDDDGDGIPTAIEGTGDPDNDGTPNYLDPDSDGDGASDAEEGTGDVDFDGIPNYLDNDSDVFDTGQQGSGIERVPLPCACNTPTAPASGLWGLALAGLLILRRRREERV